MQRTHLIIGATIAAIAGAVSGATINTRPLQRGVDAWEHVPRQEIRLDDSGIATPNLPDHYALITPQGRIEVAELRDHGLYRNRRYGANVAYADYVPDYSPIEQDYSYQPDQIADFDAPAAREIAANSQAGSAPLALEEPAAVASGGSPAPRIEAVTFAVQPKVIDVDAVLAARQ